MTASQLHIRREAKIFTNHHLIASSNRSSKRFVVSIAKAQDDLTILSRNVLTFEGKASEVTKATTGKSMLFLGDFKPSATNGLAGHIHQLSVRDWGMGCGCFWGLDSRKGFGINFVLSVDKHNDRSMT